MRFKIFGILILLFPFVNAEKVQQTSSNTKKMEVLVDRLKRQNGYGGWNNGGEGNFPMGPNSWNGPNSNGYGGPQPPPPDDSIKGSVGTKEDKPAEQTSNQNGGGPNNGEGQGPWWPNGNGPNGYNNMNGPQSGVNFPNGPGYNNGPNPYNNGNRNVDDGIKGSVGGAAESTKSPSQPSGYGYGNRGYGNNFGFNRMAGGGGYGNNFGRPILPRGERIFRGKPMMRY
ncbi:unnamed protein product [Caenorhabditis nigoni]